MPSNCYYADVKGVRLVVFDPNYFIENDRFVNYDHGNYYAHPESRGTVPPDQIAWLDRVVGEASGKVLVFSHQSLMHEGSIKNAEAIRKLFEKHNSVGKGKVSACFNGHEHSDHAAEINGIHYVQMNSLSYYWLGGNLGRFSGEEYEQLQGRERDVIYYKEPLYAFVTLESDRILIKGRKSELIGPQPDPAMVIQKSGGLPLSAEISDRVLFLK